MEPVSNQTEIPSTSAICLVCGKTSCVYCPRCRQVGYCSHDHRLLHWDAHDKECVAVNPVKIGRIGDGAMQLRSLITRNEFKSGTVVFFDAPLVRGPDDNLLSPDAVRHCFLTSSKQMSTCITCCSLVLDGRACVKCQWPVCSEKCQNDSNHCLMECAIFHGKPEVVFNVVKPARFILILRCLLTKEMNPKAWNKILALETNPMSKQLENLLDSGKPITDKQLKKQHALEMEVLKDVIRHFQLQKRFSRHLVSRVIQILNWNALPTELSGLRKESMLLYPRTTIARHSCTPNAFWSIKSNYQLLCYSRVDIRVGESLYISRVSEDVLLKNTKMRQQHLHSLSIFCECERCASADELGTHFSTVKCINFEFFDPVKGCMRGNLLPVESCNPETVWRCASCQCERYNKLVQNYMTRITLELEEAKQFVSILKYKELNFTKAKQLADLLGLRKFITVMKHHEGRTVHKNHSIIFHAKSFIIKKLTNGIAEVFSLNVSVKQKIVELINDAAAYAVKLCDECFAISSILVPGFCLQVGELIYYKQFCLGIPLPVEFRKHKQSGGANLTEFFRAFEDAKQLRSRARFIFSFYMDNPEVCKMLEFMTLDELLYSTLQKQVDQYSSSSSSLVSPTSSTSSCSKKVSLSSPHISWTGINPSTSEDVVL